MTNAALTAQKNATISVRLLELIATGLTPTEAMRAYFGDAIVDDMIGSLYDMLRAKGGK